MNERNQQLANARLDERNRYLTAKRVTKHEEEIQAKEHLRMTERRDLIDNVDITGFAPGSLI